MVVLAEVQEALVVAVAHAEDFQAVQEVLVVADSAEALAVQVVIMVAVFMEDIIPHLQDIITDRFSTVVVIMVVEVTTIMVVAEFFPHF